MAHSVVVYSTPSCPYCIRVKQFLSDNHVEFTNYDVSTDKVKAAEMVERTGQMGVPVVVIDGKPIIGFDKPQIQQALGL